MSQIVGVFSCQQYDKETFQAVTSKSIQLRFFEAALNEQSVSLCDELDAVCVFVNDDLNASVISALADKGVNHIAMRCAGYNNVDTQAAKSQNIAVSRVPAYSPHSVAEHALTLMLTLNRRTHRAYNRVREGNFSLNGLMGFTLHGKTVGVVGTGHIGKAITRILAGFGCNVQCYDPYPDEEIKAIARYVPLPQLVSNSDIITLHCPLTDETRHMIDAHTIKQMKDGVMLINTSRGALIDTAAMIQGLKSRKIGYLGIDVYEQESSLFFADRSMEIIDDDVFERLLTFPNVLITGHQGFFTREAMHEIATTTLKNLSDVANDTLPEANRVV